MAKTKSKFKGALKGAALGFALIMSSAFFPANAIANAVDYDTGDSARLNTSRIEVKGQQQSFSVKRGQTVSIPEGQYVYKKADNTQGIHVIGGAVADNITSSSVEVFYKATGDKVAVSAGKFTAEKVGTYVITYTVVDNNVPYSYEQLVQCEASEASFEFEQNDKNVIPSVYDVSIANKKDIVLPLPTVNDENDDAILTSNDEMYYVLNKDTSDITNDDKNVYVSVSLANGSESVAIQEREVEGKKEFYISGEDLSALTDQNEAELDGQDIKIFYSFYQKNTNGNDVFVCSTSKTFTVRTNYYYKDADKETAGYDLVASFSGSEPDSAIVGVEKNLPKITATTSSTNAPASESVDAYYDLVVYKANENGNYNDNNDVTSSVITEDGKFKAKEEGSYKFVYKVSDFYGNKAAESKTTFTIKNVKDTVSATAYIYDASNPNAYDADKNEYVSAENLLKSQTVNRNIVMYAVGGTDNMVAQDKLSLKRIIKDSSVERFVIDNEAYHAYNLIFAPGKAAGSTTSVWQTIISDNYHLYTQMVKAEKNVKDDAEIKEFLKANKYLIVTTKFNKDIDGNEIVADLSEDDSEATAKMLAQGYAYVKPESANYTFENKEGTFSFYYYANDNVNNNTEGYTYYSVKLANSVSDESVPTLTFASNLQSTYLPTDTFEFDVATAVDSIDGRLNVVTAYRYLDAQGTPIIPEDSETLEYYVMNANSADMNTETGKWYAQAGAHTHEGWYVADESTCEIDLNKRPQTATSVEILAYAIDDYGNAGFFNKMISIADNTSDSTAPVLYRVVNAPEATEYTTSNIALPTLYFTDANVDYMHAHVAVFKLVRDGEGKITGKTLVQSSNMTTTFDTYLGYFKVDGGAFIASTSGDYQAAITVNDSGNNSVTSYFSYTVSAGESTESPKIDNITTDPIELEPGKPHYLVPPTFTMIENEKYGYVGIDAQDDAYTSTYYDVSIIDSTNNDYELDKSYFTANSEGTYQLQYTAFLIQYDKTALTTEANKANGKVFFVDGKLMYREGDKDYFVYIDRENDSALTANQVIMGGSATALADMSKLNEVVKRYVEQSEVQVITVSEVFIKVAIDDNAYAKTTYELNQEVKIEKPSVEFAGKAAKMNQKESTVIISRTSGGTTRTVAQINFADWQNTVKGNSDFNVVGEDIYLVLKDHGEYKIEYSIQAQNAYGENVGDKNTDYKFTIASGDTKKPTIVVDNDLVIKEKYSIGDKLTINMAGLTVKDNVTTDRNTLLNKLEVTVKNTTLNEPAKTLDNKATEEGKYIYELEELETAGDYVLTFTVRDEAGNISDETTVKFEVTTSESEPASAKEIMGGILIGVSVALLVGVVGYFVVSKVKLDKKEKSYKNAGKDKK